MKLISYVCITFILVIFPQDGGWRGIKPLHSTRADVERLLGSHATKMFNTYDTGDEVAVILYANTSCERTGVGGWKVSPDTVIEIRVSPKKELRFADLQINLEKYKRVENPLTKAHTLYISEEEGITYNVFEGNGEACGKVLNIIYTPKTKDNHLRCPDTTSIPNEHF